MAEDRWFWRYRAYGTNSKHKFGEKWIYPGGFCEIAKLRILLNLQFEKRIVIIMDMALPCPMFPGKKIPWWTWMRRQFSDFVSSLCEFGDSDFLRGGWDQTRSTDTSLPPLSSHWHVAIRLGRHVMRPNADGSWNSSHQSKLRIANQDNLYSGLLTTMLFHQQKQVESEFSLISTLAILVIQSR